MVLLLVLVLVVQTQLLSAQAHQLRFWKSLVSCSGACVALEVLSPHRCALSLVGARCPG